MYLSYSRHEISFSILSIFLCSIYFLFPLFANHTAMARFHENFSYYLYLYQSIFLFISLIFISISIFSMMSPILSWPGIINTCYLVYFSLILFSLSQSRPLFLSTYHFLFYTDGIYASQVLMMFVQHERVERDARNPQPRDNLSSGSYFFGVKRPLLITSSVPPSVSTSHPLVCLVPISPRCTCS